MADGRLTLWLDRHLGEYWWERFCEAAGAFLVPVGKWIWWLLRPVWLVAKVVGIGILLCLGAIAQLIPLIAAALIAIYIYRHS